MAELDLPGEDLVLPFEIKPLGVRGRLVRLGAAVDDILHRHDYPPPVSALLAEAVALTAMLGAMLKFDGKFILQTKTDGPVDMIVADYVSPGRIRGYARFDAARVAALESPTQQALLGNGYLAMTVDQGPDMERYQGIVPLHGEDLTAAAHGYFEKSEQIPTRIRLAAGPLMQRGSKAESWRAGAIMVQHLPREGGQSPLPTHSGDAPGGMMPPRRSMTTGSRRGCCWTRWKTMSCWIRSFQPSSCFTASTMRTASPPMPPPRWRAIAAVRRRASPACWPGFPQKIRPIWWKTAKLPSPASSVQPPTMSGRRNSPGETESGRCRI